MQSEFTVFAHPGYKVLTVGIDGVIAPIVRHCMLGHDTVEHGISFVRLYLEHASVRPRVHNQCAF